MGCLELNFSSPFIFRNWKQILTDLQNYWENKLTDDNKKQQLGQYINDLRVKIQNYVNIENDISSAKQAIVAMFKAYYSVFVVQDFGAVSAYFKNLNYPLDISGNCENVVISKLLFYSYVFDDNFDNYFVENGNQLEKGTSYLDIEQKLNDVQNIGTELKKIYESLKLNELILDAAAYLQFKPQFPPPMREGVISYEKWFGLDIFLKDFGDKLKIPGVNV